MLLKLVRSEELRMSLPLYLTHVYKIMQIKNAL